MNGNGIQGTAARASQTTIDKKLAQMGKGLHLCKRRAQNCALENPPPQERSDRTPTGIRQCARELN
jgi:hypothetical protein